MYRNHLGPGCVSGDPYPLTCKFGNCYMCGKSLKGELGYYWPKMPKGKKICCEKCGELDYQAFLDAANCEAAGQSYY